ncbi:hypothetical protein VZT92_011075 [Zoarces viviparus]|uniref:Uncharacterized protein n=1 Tax=Zoarces viviparus TaxID=48416 RepID=A0AAW1FAQ0_ZOAVI
MRNSLKAAQGHPPHRQHRDESVTRPLSTCTLEDLTTPAKINPSGRSSRGLRFLRLFADTGPARRCSLARFPRRNCRGGTHAESSPVLPPLVLLHAPAQHLHAHGPPWRNGIPAPLNRPVEI